MIYGKGTGYTGKAVIVEGKTWVDAQANYDGQIRTGRFFDGDFSGIGHPPARVREHVPADRPARWTSSRTSTCWTRRANRGAQRTSA